MSQYSLDISGRIDLSDYSVIDDYVNMVGEKDKIKISIDEYEKKEAAVICTILENRDFDIQSKGGGYSGKYYIEAIKGKSNL